MCKRDLLSYFEAIKEQSQQGSPLIMGIVNVTPDSFSDGGCFFEPDLAVNHARNLKKEGADILDIGAQSTRPGYAALSEEEEWQRLRPILPLLMREDYCLSIDTMKASIALKALELGASIINDIWGFQKDANMASVVGTYQAMAVVMHNREEIDEKLDIWNDFKRFFDRTLEIAHQSQVKKEQLILDPGIGFGKTQKQNIDALHLLSRLKAEYNLPILLGVSRKSLFGHYLQRDVGQRLPATLATNLYSVGQGVDIVRVHDVQAHHDVFKMRGILEKIKGA